MQSYVYVIWLNHVVSTSAIQQTTTEKATLISYIQTNYKNTHPDWQLKKKMITKQVDGQTKKWLFNNLWFGRFERSLNQNDTIGGFRQMCRNLKVSRTTRLITKNAIEGFDQLFRPLIFEFWNRYFNKNIIYVYFSLFNLSKSVNNCLLRQLMQSSAMGIFRVLITPKAALPLSHYSCLVLFFISI